MSLNKGGGGKSSPSIRKGILLLSNITLLTPAPPSSPFPLLWLSPFSVICLPWISFTTSNSPCKKHSCIKTTFHPEKKWIQIMSACDCVCVMGVEWGGTWKHWWMMLLPFFELLRSPWSVLRSHDINSTGSDWAPIRKRFLLAFITACKNSCGLTCKSTTSENRSGWQ